MPAEYVDGTGAMAKSFGDAVSSRHLKYEMGYEVTQAGESQHDPQLLQAIGNAAAQAGLGRHQNAYLGVIPRWTKSKTFFAALWIALIVYCVVYSAIGKGDSFAWILPGFGLMVMIGSAIRIARTAKQRRTTRLDLYEFGLVVARLGTVRVARYDSTSVLQKITRHHYNGQYTGTSYSYTVTDTAGQQMNLAGAVFYDAPTWGEIIQKAVTHSQLPTLANAINAGHRLDFGDLWMTSSEIGTRSKAVPWSDISDIKVDKGIVSVSVADRWFNLTNTMVFNIPNYFVFIALADHLRAVHSAH